MNQNIACSTTVKLLTLNISRSLPWEKRLTSMEEILNNPSVNLITGKFNIQACWNLFERSLNASLVSFNRTQNNKFSKKP